VVVFRVHAANVASGVTRERRPAVNPVPSGTTLARGGVTARVLLVISHFLVIKRLLLRGGIHVPTPPTNSQRSPGHEALKLPCQIQRVPIDSLTRWPV
jgi:hypothetical protein